MEQNSDDQTMCYKHSQKVVLVCYGQTSGVAEKQKIIW